MFKNEFQGGVYLEILSVQGKDFNAKCKVLGSSINGGQKEFEKSIRSNVLVLEGESTRTKIIIPKDEKQSLYILQPFLVLQLYVLPGVSFSLEAVVIDTSNQKRRILMSTSYREISVTAFHVKIPLTILKRGIWLNLCLDLSSFVSDSFKGQSYRALESIVVCANCKLRRIFSMKSMPRDDAMEETVYESNSAAFEEIPRSLQFATVAVSHHSTQVLDMKRLINSDIKFRVGSGVQAPVPSDSENAKMDKSGKTHIAFGSRITIPKHALKSASGLNSSSGLERQVSSTSLSSSGGLNSSSSHVDLNESAASIPQVEGQRPVLLPRPPKPGSGKMSRRPNPRIRSAETAKLVKRAKVKIEDSNENEQKISLTSSDESSHGQPVTASTKELVGNASDISNSGGGVCQIVNNEAIDENNNNDMTTSPQNTDMVLGRVSRKLVVMKMGSQDDEEGYFRSRKSSESQDETRHSKDASFSSSAGSEPFFLYSSRPRSLLNGTRNRKNSENGTKNLNPPEVIVDKPKNDVSSNIVHKTASLQSDFHRQSSDSDNDDPVEKFHRLSASQRNSPCASPLLFSKTDESMSIKSSLLKEIPKPSQNYNHLKYQSVQSDSMSWMYDSDSSQMTQQGGSIHMDHSLDDKFSPIKHDNDVSPRNPRLRILDELPEGMELGNDSDDVMSDASDETSYSTWKAPPAHIRNYRYQDEMHGVGMTLDLSATLPMTPYIEEKGQIKERNMDTTDSGISIQDSKALRSEGLNENQNELDLLYDPVLNCYYDPRTHKYYELA